MRVIQDFNDDELNKLVNDFFGYFEDGFKFEQFLKQFLENIGLTEVVVTKRTGDGGIDLLGIKKGISELNDKDNVNYKVQAKRNKPTSLVPPEKIDALRGNLKFNEKGLFITTARVSSQAKENAMLKDETKPVIVIDGKDLVTVCIEKQIGFAYKPVFSPSALDELMNKNVKQELKVNSAPEKLEIVKKSITLNDIRSHIISLPRYIIDNIQNNEDQQNINIIVNGKTEIGIKFCPSRNYLSGVTKILRDNDLLEEDGTFNEKLAEWSIDKERQIIYLNI